MSVGRSPAFRDASAQAVSLTALDSVDSTWADTLLLPWQALTNVCPRSVLSDVAASPTAHLVGALAGAALAAAAAKSLWTMTTWRRKLRDAHTGAAAPGPAPLPLLGNVPQLQAAYYETLYRYVDAPASVFWVLSTPFVVVNDEDGLRRVLGGAGGLYTKPKYFGYRSRAVTAAVQANQDRVAAESIAYEPNGDTSRRALERLTADALPDIKAAAHAMLRELEAAGADPASRSVPAVQIVRKAIVELNLAVLFGVRPGDEDAARVADMIDFAGAEFARRSANPLRVLVCWLANARFVRDVSALIRLGGRLGRSLDAAVARAGDAAEGAAAGVSWVHAWMGKVGRVGKLGKVVGLLMASTQTVPLTAVWMLHLVAGRLDVRERVRAELDAAGVHSVAELEYETLDALPYTDAVVKETLRLYPPFPLIQRQAQEDDVLGGVTIPRGAIVYVVPWLVHRNGAFFRDAHDFDPDRFVGDAGAAAHGDAPSDWTYIPFGRGARMCAGSRLAMAELKVLLVHAVLSFNVRSWREGEKTDERFPALGMVPEGVCMAVESDEKTKALDAVLAKRWEKE